MLTTTDFFIFILNSFIYFLNTTIIKIFIYKKNLSRKFLVPSIFLFLISIALCYSIINTPYISYTPIVYILQIISIKTLFLRNEKSIFYIYFLLFLSNLNLNALFKLFTSPQSQIFVEVVTPFILFSITIICCTPKNSSFIYDIILTTNRLIKTLLICILFTALLLVNSFQLILLHPTVIEKNYFITFISCVLTLFVIFLAAIFPILILKSNSNEQLKKTNKSYEHQLKIQANHYQNMAQANFELRRFRHDFNNLKIGLDSLIENKKFDEAKEFLSVANDEIKNNSTTHIIFDTGNGIVDALLTDKQHNNPNIKIHFDGYVTPNKIEATDLCIIFGNTIDNAIEACNKLDNTLSKEISITARCISNFMFLHISNPVSEKIRIKNNTIISTKHDNISHGFGLYSLEQVVKKYNGEYNLSCTDSCFSIDISLPLIQLCICK